MKTIKETIEKILKENDNEVMNKIKELNIYKEMLNKYTDLSIDVNTSGIKNNESKNLLDIDIDINSDDKSLAINLIVKEFTWHLENHNILTLLLQYFDNKETTVNIGDFDGDNYVDAITAIKDILSEKENEKIYIY